MYFQQKEMGKAYKDLPIVRVTGFEFHFLPWGEKIEVATSFWTSGSNMPPAYRIWMGSNPHKKEIMGSPQRNFPLFGPSDWIRTSGLLNPIQARYQTSPNPEICLASPDCLDIIS